MIEVLTTNTFDKFIAESELPVLVDFWAPWCAPCKMMLPILEQISTDHEGKLIVAKVNVDDEPELMDGIRSIPTMRIYEKGKIVKELVGSKNRAVMELEIVPFLG